MKNEKDAQECYLFASKMQKLFEKKRENEALMWIPLETSLLFSDEFQQISPISRCIFISFLLLCGIRGSFEIPFRINYLSNTLGVNRKTLSKGIEELIAVNLLSKREKKTEKAEKLEKKESTTQTDRIETPKVGGVSVVGGFSDSFQRNPSSDFSLVKASLPKVAPEIRNKSSGLNQSQFSIEECLKYVEICRQKGEDIKNPKGLANNLFQTGNSDAFILHALYPQPQEEIDRETFGEKKQFSDEPCSICYGAKMADTDGKGYRKCLHCLDERRKATGWEPLVE